MYPLSKEGECVRPGQPMKDFHVSGAAFSRIRVDLVVTQRQRPLPPRHTLISSFTCHHLDASEINERILLSC